MEKTFDIVGVGSAIVDILSHADEALIEKFDLQKGTMALISEEQADLFSKTLKDAQEKSGGSVANTVAGVASLGGASAFIGKCRNDAHGQTFANSLTSTGAAYQTALEEDGQGTARSFVLITPDAERTMATYLGIATELGKDNIDFDAIQNAKIVFLEGYLFDSPSAREACYEIVQFAAKHDTKVALTLSDPLCVDRHRDAFMEMVMEYADIVLANEHEAQALFQVEGVDTAIAEILNRKNRQAQIFAVTKGEHGSIIVEESETNEVAPETVENVVDKTGAGDLFASGFLYGLSHGYTTHQAGRIGSIAAAEVIAHIGARPEIKLADLIVSRKI